MWSNGIHGLQRHGLENQRVAKTKFFVLDCLSSKLYELLSKFYVILSTWYFFTYSSAKTKNVIHQKGETLKFIFIVEVWSDLQF